MRSKIRTASVPLARTEGLLVERVGDETVVYDLETKEAHCLKPLAALVFEHSNGETTTSAIAAIAHERLGTDVDERDVSDAVAQLEEHRLLDVPLVVHTDDGNGVSRREAVKRFAFMGAASTVAGSLITSIVAPPAWAGLSQIPTGCTGCGQNKDCISNHCCQTVAGKQCNESCCVSTDNSCHISGTGVCTVTLTGQSCPCGTCNGTTCKPPNCCPAGTNVCCTQG